ncbi:hypothetical protein [Reinekea sp.]|jgi:hypothetical protein|uniref:hypothetical protein n=1 Tax=Reinekea sp. TaxID=1970455 RepID=UPI003989CD4F
MASSNPNYFEIDRQSSQVLMLFKKNADFIQMDQKIFNYYAQELVVKGIHNELAEVTIYPLLGSSPNGILFRSEKLRDECIANLSKVKKESELSKILLRP